MPAAAGDSGASGVTARSVVVGLAAVALISYWVTYGECVVRSSRMNVSHFPMALFIVLLVLVFAGNAVARSAGPRWGLGRGELAVVVAMGLAGAVAPASGIAGFLLGNIATPFYFASPENRWAEYLHAWIPAWLAPRDDLQGLTWFFEGLPEGQRAPWGAWVLPLAWWFALIAALVWMCACVAVVLRRRWSAEERLSYPLLEPVYELSAEPRSGLLPEIARSRLFLIGVAVPLGVISLDLVSFFVPAFPSLGLYQFRYFGFLRGAPPVNTKVNFYTIGFAYFANVNVLASIWFFYILFVLEATLFNRLGLDMAPRGDAYGSYVFAGAGWHCFGAFMVFVLWGLWMTRQRIAEAVASAFARRAANGGEEMLTDRTAVFGLLGAGVFVVFWLNRSGMALGLAALYLVLTLLIYIGVARIVCQAGLIYVQAPLTAHEFSMYTLGTASMTPASLTALGFSYALISYNRGFLMPALSHAAKLSESIRSNKRRLLQAVFLALAVGLVLSVYFGLRLGYAHGAYHYGLPFTAGRERDFPTIMEKLKNPFPTDWMRLAFFGGGAVLMAALTALSYRFPWWPLHPIGLTVCSTNVTLDSVFSVFIAWAIKTIILRLGGVNMYRKSRPLFVGLLVGQAAAVALGFLIDLIWFRGQGHQIHNW